MARKGGKYQIGDCFIMKRTYGKISAGDTVEITHNLGKKKRRTVVEVRNANGAAEIFKATYLGKLVKPHM